MNRSSLSLILLCFLPVPAVAAEPKAGTDGVPVDPAVQELDAVTSRMAAFLKALPTFEVEATTRWSLDGGEPRSGEGKFHLAVRHPNAFRLSVTSGPEDKSSLLCASDGETITRLYRDDRLVIYSRQRGGLDGLLEDAMTVSSLKGSGLDLLARSDLHSYLMASVADIEDCGKEQVGARPAHRFSAAWFGGSRVDFWIAADREPVLLRWKRTQKVELGEREHTLQIDSRLTWELDADFPADRAKIQLPPGAREVVDLQSYLLAGGTGQLLGQAAPAIALKRLDGSAWNLASHRNKHPVVLFFFATWAAPSTQDMPRVLEFVEEYGKQGAAIYAVNVGEPAETVREFVQSKGYSEPVVLDPEKRAAAAYRVTSLPVTVLIGKDGTVQAFHVGFTSEVRALIREDMGRLVAGESLVEED